MSVSQERIPKEPTAGPWNWRRFGQGIALTTTHSGSLIVLDCVRRGMHGAQFRVRCEPCVMVPMDDALTHPDLLLIESAPDLLDACRQFIAATDAADHVELANAVIAARAAIAKITGQQQEGGAK